MIIKEKLHKIDADREGFSCPECRKSCKSVYLFRDFEKGIIYHCESCMDKIIQSDMGLINTPHWML